MVQIWEGSLSEAVETAVVPGAELFQLAKFGRLMKKAASFRERLENGNRSGGFTEA